MTSSVLLPLSSSSSAWLGVIVIFADVNLSKATNLRRRKKSEQPEKREQEVENGEENQDFSRNVSVDRVRDSAAVHDRLDATHEIREEDEEEMQGTE